jgi:hypothetical protein
MHRPAHTFFNHLIIAGFMIGYPSYWCKFPTNEDISHTISRTAPDFGLLLPDIGHIPAFPAWCIWTRFSLELVLHKVLSGVLEPAAFLRLLSAF